MEASRALSRRVARSFKSLSCQCRGPKSAAAVALASCLSAGLRASGGGGVPLRPWATTTASLLRAPLLSPGPLFASFACWASGASRGVKLLASAGLVGPSAARRFSEPDCPRDSSFSKPTKEDLAAFRELLAEPESQLLWAAAPLQEGNGAETARGVSVVGAGAPQGPEGTATQVSRLAPYLTDWLGVWTPEGVEGAGAAVLFPRSTQEVQSILKHCSSRRLAVAVQGGNTGLVGGSVPVYDEVVLSLAKMNRVLSFDAETGVLVVEAGCLVAEAEAFLENFAKTRPHTKRYELCSSSGRDGDGVETPPAVEGKGEGPMEYPAFMYPLDLASKGSCCVGGTVATAAGGNRYLRYGGAHTHVLGLEAVTGDGRLMQQLNTNKKNNESLHLHHLLIGSEGTLAVITKVAIQCVPAPRSSTLTLFKVGDSFERVRRVCLQAKRSLSDILSALEFFDETSMQLTTQALGRQHPFHPRGPSSSSSSSSSGGKGSFYLLLETQGQCAESDTLRATAFAEQMQQQGLVEDAVLALTETEKADTWRLREDISAASSRACLKVLKFDVSLEVEHMYRPVELLNAFFAAGELQQQGDLECLLRRGEECLLSRDEQQPQGLGRGSPVPATAIGYGHIGDGNIHINVLVWEEATAEEVAAIQRLSDTLVYGLVKKHKGSISAEHGVGVLKAAAVSALKGPTFLQLLQGIKGCFDPQGILNPYKGWRVAGAAAGPSACWCFEGDTI